MIKLSVNWHHTCENCGTELVFDFLQGSLWSTNCPWCGTEISLHTRSATLQAVDKFSAELKAFEERLNSELVS